MIDGLQTIERPRLLARVELEQTCRLHDRPLLLEQWHERDCTAPRRECCCFLEIRRGCTECRAESAEARRLADEMFRAAEAEEAAAARADEQQDVSRAYHAAADVGARQGRSWHRTLPEGLRAEVARAVSTSRARKGLTRPQVTKRAGLVGRLKVQQIEYGQLPFDESTLVRVCQAVGLDWLEMLARAEGRA